MNKELTEEQKQQRMRQHYNLLFLTDLMFADDDDQQDEVKATHPETHPSKPPNHQETFTELKEKIGRDIMKGRGVTREVAIAILNQPL